MDFKLESEFQPSGDQPNAINQLTEGILNNKKEQILMGVTGSGKTFTIANVIANLNKPTLILAHNKTLAAQLCSEFKEFFPHNAVEYFVSYYDYYQPEAYIPSRDAYIEKEADINEEIERLRHSATRSLLTRKDVIIVASVSCIYGLGLPEDYLNGVIPLKVGDVINRKGLLNQLNDVQYERNDIELTKGRYRINGSVIDIFPSWEERILRLEFYGDELERLSFIHSVTGKELETMSEFEVFPATHYVVKGQRDGAIKAIREELTARLLELEKENKELEAHRLKARTNYDLDMMAEIGYCKGIENYSRHLSNRKAGEAPGVLMDFFPKDLLVVVDESHVTLPQVRGMYAGDQSRKQNLVDFGFRLPSAKDNRPLQFHEFEQKLNSAIYVSATPGPYELDHCLVEGRPLDPENKWAQYDLIEQVIRPTGLIDPEVDVRPSKHQIDDLHQEINARLDKKERVLITTLTKQLSEDLTSYLQEHKIKVQYLHSDITALERVDILHDLRAGKYDVLVGVNLLREGLDLPEVSLVAILDADKEGFLRNERSLIQTMGRAARNVNGKVILYADKITESMEKAMYETNRRREIQIAHNKANNITPKTITKKLTDIREDSRETLKELEKAPKKITNPKEMQKQISTLEKEMREAAKNLEFEYAAILRDKINSYKDN